jgi:hypothetical protein
MTTKTHYLSLASICFALSVLLFGNSSAFAQAFNPYMDFDQASKNPASQKAPAGNQSTGVPQASKTTPAKPQGAAPDPYTGMIQTTQVTTQQAQQPQVMPEAFFQVTQTPEPLSGSLKNKYQAMRITVKNTQMMPLEVLSGEVVNGVDSQVASREANANSQSRGAARNIFTMGLGYVPYAGYGSGAVSAAGNYADANQREADQASTSDKTKVIPHAVLNPNEIVSIVSLVPKNQRAIVKLTFRDLRTNETFTVSPSY